MVGRGTRLEPVFISSFLLAGAILNVPWLALGTVYLLFGIKVGKIVKTWLIGLSGAAVGVMLVAPTKQNQLTGTDMSGGALPQGSEILVSLRESSPQWVRAWPRC